MKVKEKIDYIYFCHREDKRNKVKLIRENIAEIWVLKVVVIVKGNPTEKTKQKLLKKMKRRFKRYQTDHCVVDAEQIMAVELQLGHQLFCARKKEMLENKKRIIEYLDNNTGIHLSRRKSFFLVLDSAAWTKKDLIRILLVVKNYYEDISIVVKKNSIPLESLVEVLYEEWGIVLGVLSEEEALAQRVDSVVFLMDCWKECIRKYSFYNGYIVLEDDSGLIRQNTVKRKQIENTEYNEMGKEMKNKTKHSGMLYSGLVYMCNGKQLPYQMAINIFNQNLELYHDFAITSVDIYSVE